MCEIDNICKKNGVKYYFSEGTALGLYRNGDLIDWDDDIDIGMDEKNYDLFLKKCVPVLIRRGYYLLYHWIPSLNKNLLSFLKDGQLIDVDNVKEGEKCISKMGKLCDEVLPHIKEFTQKQWRGKMFPVPESVKYYEYLYGKNWRIPKKTKNQNV